MVEKKSAGQESIEPFINAVRQALKALLKHDKSSTGRIISRGSRVVSFEFASLDGGEEKLTFPSDYERPYDENIALYIVKEMEYVESFLVARRLSNDLKKEDKGAELQGMIPVGFPPDDYIELILNVVGRGLGEERATEVLRYYPYPYFASRTDVPFVDFAGLLIKVLTDYVLYAGEDDDGPLVKAARAEIESAVEFLTSSDTYIEDEGNGDRLGWGFVPRVRCDQVRGGAPANRQILPTAWALFGISRHFRMHNANEHLKKRSQEILPRVMNWVLSLRTDEGLYSPNESRSQPSLSTHNYNIEALISLSELGMNLPADDIADADARFVHELEKSQDDFGACDVSIYHRVATNDTPFTSYPDRTTIANFLATLSTTTGYLQNMGDDHSDLTARTRQIAGLLAEHLMQERRDDSGLWQRGQTQFHWVLSAIEGLLRYSRFGRIDVFQTSSDAIVQAIDLVLKDKQFASLFRKHLLDAIRRMSQLDHN